MEITRDIAEKIQRRQTDEWPPDRAKRVYTAPFEQIHPVVRIAHRLDHPLDIDERIILDCEIVVILGGSGELIVDGFPYHYRGPHLFFLQPFTPHSFASSPTVSDDAAHIAIHFDLAPDVPERSVDIEERDPYEVRLTYPYLLPTSTALPTGNRIETLAVDLLEAWQSDLPISRMLVPQMVMSILAEMLRIGTVEAGTTETSIHTLRNRERVDRIVKLIHGRYRDRLTAADLAKAADLSVSRSNAIFRRSTGYLPLDYLKRHRIEIARTLLADVDIAVKEIANRCGFDDSLHFSKVFRLIDGLSPTAYREALFAGSSGKSTLRDSSM